MTFKETASAVSIANRALGMVSEGKTLTTVDDAGHNAQVVRRWYKPVVARLLEMHHWSLATKRSSLVAVANTRSNEWQFSYAAPDDMAFPVGVGFSSGSGSVSYYRGLGGLIAMVYGRAIFEYQGKEIYTNFEGDLEYVSFDITEADFTSTFEHIVILSLASKLAREIPKDADLANDLEKQALTEINIAIAQNLNNRPRTYGLTASETEMARGSMGHNWDYFPRGASG